MKKRRPPKPHEPSKNVPRCTNCGRISVLDPCRHCNPTQNATR